MNKRSLFLTLLIASLLFSVAVGPAAAAIEVNVMPSGVSSRLNIWDSGPYTWPGNTIELWGNVATGAGTLTYTWNFGDGAPNATGTVGDRNNIAVNHTYGAGNYIATLTVTNTATAETDTDTVFIDVVPQTMEVRKNLAAQRAMKYLYMYKIGWSINGCNTYYWSGDNWQGSTGLAVLAFEDWGHRESNDHTKDIYAETVERGLDAVFATLLVATAINNPNSDSDINGNLLKVSNSGGTMYQQGILAMAIANTGTPNAIASCGNSLSITGKSYKTLLGDMVDYIAFAQEESGYYQGGWRYTANSGSSDNSVSQWPALGLAAAQNAKDFATGLPWGLAMPEWVKPRMRTWLAFSQNGNGGFGYTWPTEWLNIAKTGSGIIATSYAGGGGNITNALNFIANNWNCCLSYSNYGNIGDHYAMYAVKKGLQYAGISTVGGHDWQTEYNTWYVNNQINQGTNGVSWNGVMYIGTPLTSTAFALLVMAPGLVEIPPVADAGTDQEKMQSQEVTFDGSFSHHPDPARTIVTYEWDFNYDGTSFTIDATGSVVTRVAGYAITNGTDTQLFTAALRVTDDHGLKSAINTVIVTVTNGNVAPVADPGGPYLAAVGVAFNLDGTGSSDANSNGGTNPICGRATPSGCDEIVTYAWDLDGDNDFNDAFGPAPSVSFSGIGTRTVALKVTDSFGRSAVQSTNTTTVAVSDLYLVSYQKVSETYNRVTLKWTVAWRVNIANRGNAAASLVSAKWTSTPAGVAALDDSVTWGGTIDPGETQLSDDSFSYSYSRAVGGPDLSKITWDVSYTDALGGRHVIRNVPQ